jgi:hypothetical protein
MLVLYTTFEADLVDDTNLCDKAVVRNQMTDVQYELSTIERKV